MDTYTIIGSRPVAERQQGDTITDVELVGCNISALIQGGHLALNPTKAVKVETQEEK